MIWFYESRKEIIMKLLGKVLCKLGLHDWRYAGITSNRKYTGEYIFECSQCLKNKIFHICTSA